MTDDVKRGELPQRGDPTAQDNDGGITVALMNNGGVRITDRDGQYAVEMPPFLAIDVGQRLIAMGVLQLHNAANAGTPPPIKERAPKIDIVRTPLPRKML